jgi:dynein heavy chain
VEMVHQCCLNVCGVCLLVLYVAGTGVNATGGACCSSPAQHLPKAPFICKLCSQVMDIQRAISARLTAFTFEGTDMQLKWSAWWVHRSSPSRVCCTAADVRSKGLSGAV